MSLTARLTNEEAVTLGLALLGEKKSVKVPRPLLPLLMAERERLISAMVDDALGTSFGDGIEREYLLNGVTMQGFNNMTDQELLDEAGLTTREMLERFLDVE